MDQQPNKKQRWRKHFDDVARTQQAPEKRSSYFSSANTRVLHALIRKSIETYRGIRILDAGCAEGAVTQCCVENNTVVGLDFSNNMLSLAKSNGLLVVNGDVTTPPFAKSSFDAVICAEVVTCLVDPYAGIAALSDLVRPGGILVLSVLNAASWLRKIATPLFALFVDDLPTPLSYERVRVVLESRRFMIEQVHFTHLLPGHSIVTAAERLTRFQLGNANNMVFLARRSP